MNQKLFLNFFKSRMQFSIHPKHTLATINVEQATQRQS